MYATNNTDCILIRILHVDVKKYYVCFEIYLLNLILILQKILIIKFKLFINYLNYTKK